MKKALPLWVIFIIAMILVPYSAWNAVEFVAWAAGTVRYVATTGSDANSCAASQSISTPKKTLASVIACMVAGDITYARAGTYTDGDLTLPSGLSPTVLTTLQAYQDELVTIRPSSGARVIYLLGRSYIKFWNLDIDGEFVTADTIKLEFSGAGTNYITIGGDMTAGGAFRCKVHNSPKEGISIQGTPVDNGTLTGCDVYDSGLGITVSPYAHGTYLQRGANWVVTKNRFRRNGCYGFQANGSTHPVNLTFSQNLVYDNGRTTGCGIQAIFNGTGHIIEYSAFWNDLEAGNTEGIRVEADNTTLRHLTLYNAGGNTGVRFTANASGSKLQNSVIIGSTTGIVDLGVGTTLTDNLTSGTASSIFTSVTTGAIDLSLKAGSSAIDGGTPIGLPANGGTPEQGAYEVPTFSSCEVRNGEASKVRVRFTNNLRPPMLPAASVTGVTFRKDGASNAIVSSARVGDNEYDFTVTTAFGTGDPVDMSIVPASTNLTDSSLIGNSFNQKFLSTITNQTCTNSLSGGSAEVINQVQFRFHYAYGLESSPRLRLAGDTIATAGTVHRLRIKLINTAFDPIATGFQLRVSYNGGAYVAVTNSYVNHVKMYAQPNSEVPAGVATTRQLPQYYATFLPGLIIDTANAVPNIDFTVDSETELEYVLEYESSAVLGDTYDYRLYHNDGSPLSAGGAYVVTPRVTIAEGESAL